jgi:hypothetical protein
MRRTIPRGKIPIQKHPRKYAARKRLLWEIIKRMQSEGADANQETWTEIAPRGKITVRNHKDSHQETWMEINHMGSPRGKLALGNDEENAIQVSRFPIRRHPRK